MMKDGNGNGEVDGGGEGLSFAMLSRLISEGRAGEVPVKQIPEGTNVSFFFISPTVYDEAREQLLIIQEAQPSQATMRARPKPWETASPLEPPHHPQYQLHHSQQMPGQISPTLLQYPQRSSYSSSANSPSIYNQGGSSRNSHDAIYNPTNWSSAGPTISPDLSLETFSLDPDFASLRSGPSSGLTTTTGSVGTPFDESTFSNYLNVDYDPTNTNSGAYSNMNPINLAPPIVSSSSTPAPAQAPPPAEQGFTPASSYSL